MIIEPNSSEKFTGGDGQVWVSLAWVRKQTATPSTNGWTEAVVDTMHDALGGRHLLRKNGMFYKLDDVIEAFRLYRNTQEL